MSRPTKSNIASLNLFAPRPKQLRFGLFASRARDTFACQNLPRDTSEMAQCADVNPDYVGGPRAPFGRCDKGDPPVLGMLWPESDSRDFEHINRDLS